MLRSLLAVALLAPIPTRGADDPVLAERRELEGTWVSVKGYRANGEEIPNNPAQGAEFRVTFAGETMTNSSGPGKSVSFKITLDPTQSPRAIDMIRNREGSPPQPGIYRVTGDVLEIAWSSVGSLSDRPALLAPCPKGSPKKWTYGIYRRDKGPAVVAPAEAAKRAAADLESRRDLPLGQPAPEIDGVDLDGKPLRLADYRGKVVVLVFWGSWCLPCLGDMPHDRALAERLRDKPFALLGIDCHDERPAALKVVREKRVTWRNWYDGVDDRGPIALAYRVASFPTVYVLDAKGVLRAKQVRGRDLDQAVDSLLAELERPTP